MAQEIAKYKSISFNGGWTFLLKLFMAIFPLALASGIAFNVWVAKNVYEFQAFQGMGVRFTKTDGHDLEAQMKRWVEEHFPRNSLVDDVREIKTLLREDIKMELRNLDARLRTIEGKVK